MKNQNYRYEIPIREQIKKLSTEYIQGRSLNIRLKKIEDRLTTLDNNNSQHVGVLHSVNETMKMVMNTIMCIFCFSMDFTVVYNAIALFCSGQILLILRVLIPFAFVGAEIWISYMVIEKRNAGFYLTWVERNLKYLIIAFLVAFSVLSIIYSVVGYRQDIDGSSVMFHILSTVFSHIFLLVPAIALHVWIIKHAEEIYLTFTSFLFKSTRSKPTHLHKKDTKKQDKLNALFVKNVYILVEMIERFTAQFDVPANYFATSMSRDLIQTINTVMGKTIFDPKTSNNHSYDIQ